MHDALSYFIVPQATKAAHSPTLLCVFLFSSCAPQLADAPLFFPPILQGLPASIANSADVTDPQSSADIADTTTTTPEPAPETTPEPATTEQQAPETSPEPAPETSPEPAPETSPEPATTDQQDTR